VYSVEQVYSWVGASGEGEGRILTHVVVEELIDGVLVTSEYRFYEADNSAEAEPKTDGSSKKESVSGVSHDDGDKEPIDTKWIEAYYNYVRENSGDAYFGVVRLIDLNFDGVPEFFNVVGHDGTNDVREGLTILNGKVIPINVDGKVTRMIGGSPVELWSSVTVFAGTTQDAQGRVLWQTYSCPAHPQSWPNASLSIHLYDYSDLTDIKWIEGLCISFHDIKAYTDEREIQVTVERFNSKGFDEAVKITDAEHEAYLMWYESDFDTVGYTQLLPHLAQWSSELSITQQKSIEVYYRENGIIVNLQELDYEDFKAVMLQWYRREFVDLFTAR